MLRYIGKVVDRRMRVLGIDPGTAIMGWGVIEQDGGAQRALAFGALETPPEMAVGDRLKVLYHGLQRIIDQFRPDRAAVEELFFGQNVKTAIHVGQARGICLLALAEAEISLTELKPSEVKLAVAGYGAADKAQVERMVVRLLGLDETPKPDDVADALAIALTGYEYWRYRERVAGS